MAKMMRPRGSTVLFNYDANTFDPAGWEIVEETPEEAPKAKRTRRTAPTADSTPAPEALPSEPEDFDPGDVDDFHG